MSTKYVDPVRLSKANWKRFYKELSLHSHFSKPFDIWLDEVTKVSSKDCPVDYTPISIKSGEYGETNYYFVRFFTIRPTHTNTMTKYYMDDIYSFASFKGVSMKDRTNILKFVQRHLDNQ
jgi:hypothetical protein